jgi:hypothetical protein
LSTKERFTEEVLNGEIPNSSVDFTLWLIVAFLCTLLIKYSYTFNFTNDLGNISRFKRYGLDLKRWNDLCEWILWSVDNIEKLDSNIYNKLGDIEIIFIKSDQLNINYP